VLAVSASKVAEAVTDGTEEHSQKQADIALCWVKYYVNLLCTSREKLQGDNVELSTAEVVRFTGLQLPEADVPKTLATNYAEAREIFLNGQTWVKMATQFYVLDGFVSDHIQCCQDQSQLYRHLGAFETDPDRASRMHKRRIDLYSGLVAQLNPQHFLAVLRQLHYEMAETYVEMMQLKLGKFKTSQLPDLSMAGKINKFISQAIGEYDAFTDLLRDAERKLPETIDETLVRPYLTARFWVARLVSQFIAASKDEYLANLQTSMDEYNTLIAYCDAHPDLPCFKEELELCREMVSLLPTKMQRALMGE
jgi:hypothetical protein